MTSKKFNEGTALAKIRVLLSDYYEKKGKGFIDDSYGEEGEIIDDIEDILLNAEIDTKKVIMERLELDKLNQRDSLM